MPRRLVAGTIACALLAAGCGSSSDDHAAATGSSSAPTTVAKRAASPAPRAAARGVAGAGVTSADVAAVQRIAQAAKPVYCGGTKKPMVALTFDDGPGPYTHFVLKRLRRNDMRATFFLVGRNLPLYGDLVAGELKYGTLGDHTMTHPLLTGLAPAQANAEIDDAQEAIGKKAGFAISLFRDPYGAHDAAIDAHVRDRKMVQVLWNVDSRDSEGANYAQIFKNVTAGLKPGAIILMHDNRGQTVRTLPPILHAVRNRHLQAVTVPELLAADPPSAHQLALGGRGCPSSPEVGGVGAGGG